MPKIEKTCECGKTFTTYPSVDKVHCSRSCSLRYQPRKPRRGTTTACPVCGKPVYANASQQAKGQGQYCSRACHNAAQSRQSTKSCAWCGAEMRLSPSELGRQYCSRACMGLAAIQRPLERWHNGRQAKADAAGYVMLWEPSHPNKSFNGWQYEHRLIAEAALGRFLRSDEAVHHRNHVKDDNRPENLEVMDALAHATLSVRDYQNGITAELGALRAEVAEYRRRYGPLTKEEQ